MLHLLLALSLSPVADAADAATYRKALDSNAGWTEVKKKTEKGVGPVTIRQKSVSGIDCLEGIAEVSGVTRARLLEVAADIPSATKWSSADLKFSEVLGKSGGKVEYIQYLDNPMPISDRYWMLAGHSEVRDPVSAFHWEHISPSKYPAAQKKAESEYSGTITSVNVGSWVFTDVNGGVEVRYRLCTAVGGSIPQWAGEYAATSTLPTNVSDLVAEARRRGN